MNLFLNTHNHTSAPTTMKTIHPRTTAPRRSNTARILAGSIAALLAAYSAHADNTWDGGAGGSFNWSDNVNWGADSAPGYGTLIFTGAVGNTNTLDAYFSMNQVNWNGTSAWTLNASGGSVLSLYDNGGTQAKLENLGSGLVTINAPVTFAATSGSNWGEINAVSGDMTFGTGTLTVNGSGVAGIRLFGAGRTTTFNNTVSAAGKYFSTSAVGTTVGIGGAFTAGDLYIMNDGVLNLNTGSSVTANVRLGGDFATTGTQDLSRSGTLNLTPAAGGLTFAGVVNSVPSNTSGTLAVNSQNTSGTNTLSGQFFLDSALQITQTAGGTLALTNATGPDLKGNTLTLTPASGSNISISGGITNSTGSGSLTHAGAGTTTLTGANSYTGATTVSAGTLSVLNTVNTWKSSVAIAAGATFNWNVTSNQQVANTSGNYTISGAGLLTLSGGFKLDFGNGTPVIQFNMSAGGQMDVQGNNTRVEFGYTHNSMGGNAGSLNVATGAGYYNSDADAHVDALTGGGIVGNAYNGTFTLTVGVSNTVNNATYGVSSNTATFSGVIKDVAGYNGQTTGATVLIKTGTGKQILSGANTYTGATTISAGSLQLGNGGTTGSLSAASAITNSGNLIINRSNAVAQGADFSSAAITGNGSFTQAGTGTTTLTAANTYTGATTISAGTLKLDPGVTTAPTTAVAGYAQWFDASTISGSNGATISTWTNGGTGSNATVPSGQSNTAPTLLSNAGTGTGLSALHFNAGNNATNSQALNFTQDTNVRTVFSIFKGSSFLMTDSGSYALHRPGDGNPADALLANYGQINYLGTVYVNGSAVNPTSDAMPTNLHNGYNLVAITTNGNAISLNGFNDDRGTIHAGDQSQAEVLIYDSVLNNTQRLAVEAYLNNKWFGTFTPYGAGSLPSASPVTIASGATLDLNGVTQQIASLTGPSGGSVTNSGAADSLLTISGASNTDFGGVISNGATNKISFVKSGASIQTLSGANTYTGATSITASTLKAGVASVANTSGAFGNNSAVSLSNVAGATMDITGFNTRIGSLTGGGTTGGNVTLGAATLTVGGDNTSPAAYAGVLSGTGGGLTKIGVGTQTLSGANTYTGSTTVNGGGLTLTGSGLIAAASNIQVTSGTLAIADGGGGRTLANNMVLNGGMVMVQGFLANTGTGGTITFSGGNVVHTFTASGSLVLPVSIGSASELIVGAGGGGGAGVFYNVYNAGGGGGQVSNLAAQALASGTIAVVVGAGGAGGNNAAGQDGGASSIGGNTAAGGFGANDNNGTGGTSGSGNLGAGRNNGYFGGGGGGDSAAGSGTNGGAGTAGTITGSFYGGGGGAGPNGVGGVGGGGNGDSNSSPTAGTANTGGGGGGGGTSAAGGSGIAIVQYAYAAGGAGAVTLSGTIDLQTASTLDAYATGALLSVTGLISTSTGSGGLTIASSSTSGGVVRFGSANTYLGNTTVNSGATLRMNTTNALPSGSGKGNLSLSGTLDLNGQATTSLNGLSGAGTINNQTGAGTYALSVGNNDQTSAFGGVIQNTTGTLGLTKTGTGTLTLSGANTYTGTTTISAGILNVNADAALGNAAGAVSISNGATLQAAGTVTTAARTLTLGAGGGGVIDTNGNTVSFNSGSTVTGTTLTKTGAGTLNFGVSSGLTGLGALAANNGTTNVNSVLGTGGTSTVNVTGATTLKFGSVSQTLSSLTIGAGSTVTFTSGLASFSGGGGKVARLGGSAVVPEPGTLGLLLVGTLGMLHRRRRQA